MQVVFEGNKNKTANTKVEMGRNNYEVSKKILAQDYSQGIRHPFLKPTDLIYNHSRNTVPFVNEEYNLVFFLTAKVASTEFVRFFARLEGNPNWCGTNIHHPQQHKLRFLNTYTLDEAHEIMTSPKWKKVIFVRHPKARLLSAFLDKAIQYSKRFTLEYCVAYKRKGGSYDQCVKEHEKFDFFLRKITQTLHEDVHWRTIYSRIDEKWWPYIDFIGNMDNLANDAKTFLSSIHSNIDGVSAWDKIGTHGWSGAKNNGNCTINIQSQLPFLGHGRDKSHTTGASAEEKMKRYYTPDLERFVERQYADDLNNPFFQFDPLILYPPEEGVVEQDVVKEQELV